jgi:hypothetical protein
LGFGDGDSDEASFGAEQLARADIAAKPRRTPP